MTDTKDIIDSYQRREKAQAMANELNKAAVFDLLAATAITTVTVEFDGEGDSGQMNDITAYKVKTVVALPDSRMEMLHASWSTGKLDSQETSLYAAIETLCYDYLAQKHGGWEDNEGGFGEFTFVVAERTVEFEFNARFCDSILSSDSF